MRALAFPGSAHIPACRVRSDSPHFEKFRRLSRKLADCIPHIEPGELKAFEEGKKIALRVRTGLMFHMSYTSTILRRVLETMEAGGRPGFYDRIIDEGGAGRMSTTMMPSFWDMLMLMRDELINNGLGDMIALEEQGVLVRSRKVPIAIRAPPGGFHTKDGTELYAVVGKPVPIRDVIMLGSSGAAGLLKEIIRAEARHEAMREGGPFSGRSESSVRGLMLWRFRYEVSMSLSDTEEPVGGLPPQS